MQTNKFRKKLEQNRIGKMKRAQWTQCGQKCNLKTRKHTHTYTHTHTK